MPPEGLFFCWTGVVGIKTRDALILLVCVTIIGVTVVGISAGAVVVIDRVLDAVQHG